MHFCTSVMKARSHHTHQEEADMDATTVAVDLAKDVFEVALATGPAGSWIGDG